MPEPTLLPEIPREISTPLAKAGMALLGVIALAIPLLLVLALQAPDVWKYHRLSDRGISGSAVIIRLYDRSTKGNSHVHHASYRYAIDGRTYEAEDRLPYELGSDLRSDAQLTILYDPTNPSWSVVDRGATIENRYRIAASSLELIGGVASVPFLFAVLVICTKYLKEYRLLKWGTATKATIVAEETVQGRGHATITLHYEFFDAAGTKHLGERAGLPLPEAAGISLARHQRLTIDPIALYHPGHPELNALYPFDIVELRYEMGLISGEVAS